jgi:dTMP kinase
MSTGKFITFEGGEGAGKSTQIKLFCDSLVAAGIACLSTREPGGTPEAEAIRTLLVTGEPGKFDATTELLLHYAARRNHVEKFIRPKLAENIWVVCDRFTDSSLAYQGFGHKLGAAPILKLQKFVLGKFQPDLTFILDIEVKDGMARAEKRKGQENRYEKMDQAFHERIRDGYLAIASKEPKRCAVVNATGPVAEVHADIIRIAGERLKLKLTPAGGGKHG